MDINDDDALHGPLTKQIVISLHHDGFVRITGPIHEKMLCYGLLELARDVVKAFSENAERQSRIAVVPNGVLKRMP